MKIGGTNENMVRKLLSALLAIAIVVGFIPAWSITVLAAGNTYTFDLNYGNVVISVASVSFSDASGIKTQSYNSEDSIVITQSNNNTPTSSSITVENNVTADITLDGVNISGNGIKIGFQQTSSVHLKLVNDNKIVSSANTAMYIGSSGSLIITGESTGSLNAQSGSGHAGIENNGTLTIDGGTVTATGEHYGAGIGGSENGAGSIITITGGTVTATGGQCGAGIGQGYSATGGTVTITGGTVTATGGNMGAGIGRGFDGSGGLVIITGGTVTANGGGSESGVGIYGGAGIGGCHCKDVTYGSGTVRISGGKVTATGGKGGAGIGGGNQGSNGTTTITGGRVTATGGSEAAGIGGGYRGGGGTVRIDGGTVTATGGNNGAGIGGGFNCVGSGDSGAGGSISITAGEVTATGVYGGAGIGGGSYGVGGSITIAGGKVTARGGTVSNDIGSGANVSSISAFTIAGGSVKTANNAFNAGYPKNNAGDRLYLLTVNATGASIDNGSNLTAKYGTVQTAYTAPSGHDGIYSYLWLPEGDSEVHYTKSGIESFISTKIATNNTNSISIPIPVTYAATVENGTGSGNYAKDANVSITADTAPSGKEFDKWISSDGMTFANANASSTTFTMPEKAVTVTATYKDLPVVTYTVTFNKNGGDTEAGQITKAAISGGNVGTLPTAPTKSGYNFSGWNTAANGSGTVFTAATAVTANLTVYAQWTLVPSGGSPSGGSSSRGGGGSSSGGVPANTPTTTITTNTGTASSGVTSTTTATAKSDSNGKAAATVTDSQVKETVCKAEEAAAKQGEGTAAEVEIKVTAPAEANTVETSLPKTAVTAVADKKIDNLTVATPVASISFDKAAITTISKEAAADVKITVAKVDASGLSETAKVTVGDRPVFNFSVTSGDKTISQFGGTVALSIPYTPKAGEDTNAIVIYYINAEGKPEVVTDCRYDPTTGKITFTTNHFSQYAVGYNKVNFNDVAASAWYSDAVSFVAARGIATGTGNSSFSPNAELTRGEFLIMVMRAYRLQADENTKDNFADAGNTYYTGYLAAAKKLGITTGIGNNMFAPDKKISRQEMATLLYNTLKQINEIPKSSTGKTMAAYSDTNKIASWAEDAVTLFVKTGTISGSGGKLNPDGTTNRAQMAQVLYNLRGKTNAI